ncbi:MAG: hypothetical protein KKD69_09520 [Euryarchaeota archaeon]|nr:hypothetical protein [Euryarchaeota archaeon]MBU4492684.1 hypothetical protein [Euryarchaeota archaeon]MCG2727435.1 RAMP superfamily CRISPR-associated protein [Candidatus Methanoperedenaceae archaeon]
MKILKISLSLKNDFHTTGESKGSLVDFLRNSKDEPYIPATHIKGIMRTEAERLLRSTENIPCYITGNPNIMLCDEVKGGGFRCDVCRVFGVPNTEGGGDYREGKIRITDFMTKNEVTAVSRMHVSIMRETQTKMDYALFNMQSVPSKTEFTGFVIIRETLTDSEDKLLKASIHSMAHYGIGKDRSRGLGGIKELKISEISQDEYLEVR